MSYSPCCILLRFVTARFEDLHNGPATCGRNGSARNSAAGNVMDVAHSEVMTEKTEKRIPCQR